MRKTFLALAMSATFLAASPALAQDTQTYNSDPTATFNYGSGNDYIPSNSAVLTTTDPTSQLAGRAHIRYEAASPSDANGVYYFDLGSDVSFDYGFSNFLTGEFLLTNLLTGQTFDSGAFPLANSLLQDSQFLEFGFLASLGFDADVNNTYKIDLIGTNATGAHTDTFFAQLGSGAPAVPEPATWAMMLLGFGAIGFSMRRKKSAGLLQVA